MSEYPELKNADGKSYVMQCCNVVGVLTETQEGIERTEERLVNGQTHEVVVKELTHTIACPNDLGCPVIEVHQTVEL